MVADLEGSIFAFEFYADYTDGHSALALFWVINGKLEQIWDPCDHETYDEIGSHVDEIAIRELGQIGITKVFTLGNGRTTATSPREFLGYELYWRLDEDNWGGYDPLSRHYWERVFQYGGIELKFYNDYEREPV